MPKHVPTFKHLIATSTTRREDRAEREWTVNDRLAASRAVHRDHVIRDLQHAPLASSSGERVWTSTGGTEGLNAPIAEEGAVHPYVARFPELECN
jgi:hypothetical protein